MTPDEAPAPQTWKERLFSPRALATTAAGLALGLAAAAVGWRVWLVPIQKTAELRAATVADVMTLYDMEQAYKRAHGTYASGLDAILPFSSDPAALKARMARHLDLTTLAVIGGADKFRIEANVLDAARTLVRVSAPSPAGPPARPANALPLAVPAAADADTGAPLAPGNGR